MKNNMTTYLDIFGVGDIGSARSTFDWKTGNAWFCATDVAQILGFENISEAIEKNTLAIDRKMLKYNDCGQVAQTNFWGKDDHRFKLFINESGLFSMIFGSKLEKAQEFRHWVTSEVLPDLLKSGLFIMMAKKPDETSLRELKDAKWFKGGDKIDFLK